MSKSVYFSWGRKKIRDLIWEVEGLSEVEKKKLVKRCCGVLRWIEGKV